MTSMENIKFHPKFDRFLHLDGSYFITFRLEYNLIIHFPWKTIMQKLLRLFVSRLKYGKRFKKTRSHLSETNIGQRAT